MGRVVLELEHAAHAAALLPVLPWLRRAGLEVAGARRAHGSSAREVDAVARHLGLDPPEIDWSRRVHVRPADVLLGTTDDLAKLREVQAETRARFVAAARLPLPATLLSVPAAPVLERVAQEHLATPAGRLLCASDPEAVPALARRTGSLPLLLTGCAEVALPGPGAADACVVLFPGDLPLEGVARDEALDVQEAILERALRPLAKQDLAFDVRATLGAAAVSRGACLREIAARVTKALGIAPDAILVRDHEGFGTLAAARAVLTLSERDLLRALVAGAARAAFLAFALEPDLPGTAVESTPGRLRSAAELGAWAQEAGQPRPIPGAARIAELLGPLSGPTSAERIAQVVLATAS